MSWILKIAKLISPDLIKRAKTTNVIQVLTISFSHYCELSNWALEKGNKVFEEHAYAPAQHVLPCLALRVGGKEKYLSNSSRFNRVTADSNSKRIDESVQAAKDRKARSTSVPVAIFPDGTVYCDSWTIAAQSGLPNIENERLKKLLDEELGPLARQGAYVHILKDSNKHILTELFTINTHWVWRFLWFIYVGGYLRNYMIKFLRTSDPVAVKECRDKLDKTIAEIGDILSASKTPFLGGETIGVADIAIASLMGPLINPPLYCRGKFTPIFDKLAQQDPEVAADTLKFRNTVAGEYALRLYRNHRV